MIHRGDIKVAIYVLMGNNSTRLIVISLATSKGESTRSSSFTVGDETLRTLPRFKPYTIFYQRALIFGTPTLIKNIDGSVNLKNPVKALGTGEGIRTPKIHGT